MTIQDYATSRGITYEASRLAVKKAEPEILKHITKQGRTRIIDPDGVKMLDDIRKGSRVAVVRKKDTEHQNIVDQLKNEIIVLQRQLLDAQAECNKTALLSSQAVAKLETVTDTNKMLQAELDRKQADIDRKQSEIDTLRTENGKYHKTIFGFYRKDKT